MTETKHSPGPWEVHGDYTHQLFYVHGANTICDIHRGAAANRLGLLGIGDSRFSRKPSEDEANAHLIAAAPDLLDACKQAHAILANAMAFIDGDTTKPIHIEIDYLVAAIAKATGQPVQ